MQTGDYHSLFVYLMEQYCLPLENMVFVDSVSDWCKDQGIEEPDKDRPLRMVIREPGGCRMLIRKEIRDEVISRRMNALSVRNQPLNVASDVAERLNSDRKKLAYLFLSEYAGSLPEIRDDERMTDEWAINEMERLGFFQT
ncbi:MAG: hypothetical protein M0024_13555 [Nitrospiraceae bacterium]|nr:hypothetical protein [Nitrospiraceae bacterium]